MPRRFRLIFPSEDVTAMAEMLEREAPRTCDILWEALPFEGDLIHGMWSGPECYLPLDARLRCPAEHQSTSPLPGEIGFYSEAGGRLVGWPDDFAEIALFYGREARPSMPDGPVAMNVFARVVDGLEPLASICARIHREGVKPLRVERAA